MSPGTGVTGTQTFSGNFMKQLANSTTMDPVVLDIPDNFSIISKPTPSTSHTPRIMFPPSQTTKMLA
jgi:hypothetical protein